MKKVKSWIQRLFLSEALPLEMRTLNFVCLLATAAVVSAFIVRIVSGMPLVTIIAMVAVLAVLLTQFRLPPRNGERLVSKGPGKATIFVLYSISLLLWTLAFFTNAGPDSGMAAYFALTIIMDFLLLNGAERVIALLLTMVSAALCYGATLFWSWPIVPAGGLNAFQRFLDNMQSIYAAGFFVGAVVIFQNNVYLKEKDKAEAASAEALRNKELLMLVNEAAVLLLTSEADRFEAALTESMQKMAECLDVDRVHIWRGEEQEGMPIYRQLYSWLSQSADASQTLGASQGVDWVPRMPEWDELFKKREYILETVDAFTDEMRAQLAATGIKAIVAFPMFLHERFWGFVSFENCHSETLCPSWEAAILQSGSLLLANAIERNETLLQLGTRLSQQRLMSSISSRFLSKETMGGLITETLARMGEFLNAERVLIAVFEKDSEISRPQYVWFCDPKYTPSASQKGFSKVIRELFPHRQPLDGEQQSIYCDDTLRYDGGRYRIFYERGGLKAFICSPIYVEDELWGVMSIEKHSSFRQWSQSDAQLVNTVSSAVSNAIARDIMEKECAAALEQALRASRSKGDFLSNMSHEMRTPMNVIIGMTSIGKSAQTIEKKDYAFDKIADASKHLLGVINDILDMSKIEANKLELSNVRFDFENMIQKVVNVINFRLEERRQRFSLHISDDIPRMLVGDDHRLAQVITNLLANAVKFTPEEGAIRLDAFLAAQEDGLCRLQISVRDTGIGITGEQKNRLFRSFEQADAATSRKYGGTGLGLAITKRVVELMGGEIWVESEQGKGSKFSFTVLLGSGAARPQSPQGEDAVAVNESACRESGSASRGKDDAPDDFSRHRILLAEDVEINREIVLALLEPTNISVECAMDGMQALRMFEEDPGRYDMIFMDVQMPEMDGYEATQHIRALNVPRARDIPIVAMTANVFREDVERCLAAGMNAHIGKPLDIDEVLVMLRTYLRQRR